MTKEEMLRIMRLLSALEAAGMMRGPDRIPDYLLDELSVLIEVLEREVLK
jgi:hypothetical protein